MSLVGLMLRLTAVRALRGKTMAGQKIFDSAIAPIDELRAAGGGAIVTLYTDEDRWTLEGYGNDLNSGQRDLRLTFDCAVANRIEIVDGTVVTEIGETDAALEATIDLLQHDLFRTLQADPGPYAEAFRALAGTVKTIEVRRGAGSDKGLRFAARDIVMSLDAADDPQPVPTIVGTWSHILAAFAGDGDAAPILALIRSRLTASPDTPDWEAQKAALGLTDFGAHAIGLGPDEPPPECPP